MSGATAGGWPYVTPDDHPLEYPAFSQQFALFAEAQAAAVLGTLTPASGWVDYGTSAGGMHVTRQGKLVTINALMKRTSDLALVVNTGVDVATVPAGLRPAASTFDATFYQLTATGAPVLGRLVVHQTGQVQLFPSAAGTLTTTGLVAVTIPYRAA